MQRRDFCKMAAAAAAATALPEALPLSAQKPAPTGGSSSAGGFNKLSEDYAQFCALPEGQRVFYALIDGKIIAEKLDESTWKATEWGDPPALPVPGGSWDGVPMESSTANLSGSGAYQPTWESLLQYETPEWYRDAKFGIWAHWSPQCVPEAGDWYARNMYVQGSPQNKYHLEHYGPPSRFGLQRSLCSMDPAELGTRCIDRALQKAGARFLIALANHHDGFDTWNSKYQPWNSANLGPHLDLVGEWAAAARKQGLRLGVTVHQARNWWWFQPTRQVRLPACDMTGLCMHLRARISGGRAMIRSDSTVSSIH